MYVLCLFKVNVEIGRILRNQRNVGCLVDLISSRALHKQAFGPQKRTNRHSTCSGSMTVLFGHTAGPVWSLSIVQAGSDALIG